jgi:uncharacterized membrane protein
VVAKGSRSPGSDRHATKRPHGPTCDNAAVKLLRRVLYVEAACLAVYGLLAALVPIWLLQTVFDQPSVGEYAWVRMTGIQAIGFAMMYVMVAHRAETLWWFSWAFVLTGGAIAILSAVNALFGLPDPVSPLFWWLLAAGAALNTTGLLLGIGKTGLERPAE